MAIMAMTTSNSIKVKAAQETVFERWSDSLLFMDCCAARNPFSLLTYHHQCVGL